MRSNRTRRRARVGLVALACTVVPLVATGSAPVQAQPRAGQMVRELGPEVVLQAGQTSAYTFVPPLETTTASATSGTAAATAVFQPTLTGFPPEAQAAFERAIEIWGGLISSPMPIKVSAIYEPLNNSTLASARTDRFRDFPGAPIPETFYPFALANALAGFEVDPFATGIVTRFNSSYHDSWYFGTDGRPPSGKFDFVTIALHEIGHGLGFEGTMRSFGTTASWGTGTPARPAIYDRFTTDVNRVSLIDTSVYPNNSAELRAAVISENVYFDSSATNAADGTGRLKLYAPKGYIGGSSYVHLDEDTYPPGNPNSLLTPTIARDETIHSPGPAVLCAFEAIGWSTAQACPAGLTASATEITPTTTEPGDSVTVAGRGVGAANASYTLKLGTTVFNCPTGLTVGGPRNSDANFNIPPVQRIIPTNLSSGHRWLCWVRTGDPGDWSAPVRVIIV